MSHDSVNDDLISRAALMEKVGELPLSWEYGQAVQDIWGMIKAAPAVDAVPVVHGRWESASTYEGIPTWMCNKCSHGFGRQWNYCPNCGQ